MFHFLERNVKLIQISNLFIWLSSPKILQSYPKELLVVNKQLFETSLSHIILFNCDIFCKSRISQNNEQILMEYQET